MADHNSVFLLAQCSTAKVLEATREALERATLDHLAEVHGHENLRMGVLSQRRLAYSACVGDPCRLEDLRFVLDALPAGVKRDVYWTDAESLRCVCDLQGAYPLQVEVTEVRLRGEDREDTLYCLSPLLQEPSHEVLTRGRLRERILVEPRVQAPLTDGLEAVIRQDTDPASLPATWRPLVARLQGSLAEGRSVSAGLVSADLGSIGSVETLPDCVHLVFDFDKALTWLVDSAEDLRELDPERNQWTEDIDDVDAMFLREAARGDPSAMASVGTRLRFGSTGPIDELGAAFWYRRAIETATRRREQARNAYLAKRAQRIVEKATWKLSGLLTERPDLREPGDPS